MPPAAPRHGLGAPKQELINSRPLGIQWIFQVPLEGGRWHIIPQLAVYTTYILPCRGLYNPYHPLQEPENPLRWSSLLLIPNYGQYKPVLFEVNLNGNIG